MDENDYEQRSCGMEFAKIAGLTTFTGLFVSALQNSLQKHSHGAKGVFTRTGSTITSFGKE